MNQRNPVIRRPRGEWSPTARLVVAIIAAAGLAVPGAAFGGSQSTNTQRALVYSRCMRSHGVLKFPDPNSGGAIPKVGLQELAVSSTVFQAAQKACQHLLPNSGQSSQAWDQKALNALWNFARCVRAHGVPNWPDPLAESDPGQSGTPGFPGLCRPALTRIRRW